MRHLAGLLEPGGWLVFGINDWPADLPGASERREETKEGIELVEVIPDSAAMTCTHRVTLMRPDGRRDGHALMRRHYSLPGLWRLLVGNGFVPLATFTASPRNAPTSKAARTCLSTRGAPDGVVVETLREL